MEPLMYGMTPSANTAQFCRPPPVIKIANPTKLPPTWLWIRPIYSFNEEGSTPGHGIFAPTRARAIMPSVIRIRRRSSGIFQLLRNAENILLRRDSFRANSCQRQDFTDTAGLCDFFAGRRAELLGFYCQFLCDFAITENLHTLQQFFEDPLF